MPKYRHALLWSVKAPQCDHESYVMGTMHVRDQRAFGRFEILASIMDQVEVFWSEVDLDELQVQPEVFDTSLPEGTTILSLLGKKYDKVRKICLKTFEVDIWALNEQVPMVLVNFLTEAMLQKDHALPLDFALWQMAKDKGLSTGGVESLEEHAATLKAIPMDLQIAMLLKLSRNVKKFRKKVYKLADLFVEEKIHQLYRYSKKDLGGLKDVLLFDRNKKMSERFLMQNETSSLLMAVGAGHLSGKKGVLHLLRQSGATIKPLI